MREPIRYPETATVDHVDDYHGTAVADPYRWLEQPADTPEVRAWISAQNEVTERYLDALPAREAFRQRLTALWDHPKAGVPFRKGGRLFQFRNSGLQNQDVLYVSEPGAADPAEATRTLIDPNLFSEDGTVALTGLSVSPDGARVAYALSEGGSDWKTWRVRDVASGEDLPDTVPWSKFSDADWLPDGSGFLYVGYPEPEGEGALVDANRAPRLKLHRLGDETDDAVILHRPDEPDWILAPQITHDETWLVVYALRGTDPATRVWVAPLAQIGPGMDLDGDFTPLQSDFAAQTWVVGNDGATFYLQTDQGAERKRVVATDLDAPDAWREVLPEGEHPLVSVSLQRDTMLTVGMVDATHRLHRWRLRDGAPAEPLGEIALPTLGSVTGVRGERDDDAFFLGFTSFLFPTTPYRLRYGAAEAESLGGPDIDVDTDGYVTRQLWATSKDGTRVPMFVVHREGLAATGDHPTLLYGYGGFNVSLTPSFSAARLAWLERGGVLAVANLRGGGEYGRAWHDAGRLANKQNVFDDAVACAEALMAEGVTDRDRLAVQGGSNGGLLVGALVTQRPDLFGAAHAAVGVMDMLRFHHFTIGWAWASDYGSADDPEQFRTLFAYSPLHNLRAGESYPPTLITTGDHDDRVVPAHSFKFAAAMQAVQMQEGRMQGERGGSAPALIRIETRAGHGMGKPTRLTIEEYADVWAFLADALGMEVAGAERAA